MNTGHRQVLHFFPRRWRSRYGEEFLALLDDLSPDAPISATERRAARRTGRELGGTTFVGRPVVVALSVVVVAAGVGLGLGLTASTPAPSLRVINGYSVASAVTIVNLPECSASAAAASGARVVGSDLPAGFLGSTLPKLPSKKVMTGSITMYSAGGPVHVPWALWAVGTYSGSSATLDGLEDGNLIIGGHWYSLCDTGNDTFTAFATATGRFATSGRITASSVTLHVVNWFPSDVIFGFMPSDISSLYLFNEGGAGTLKPIRTFGNEQFFVSELTSSTCVWSFVGIARNTIVVDGSFGPLESTANSATCSTGQVIPNPADDYQEVPLQPR